MLPILENGPCALDKNVCCAAVQWNVYCINDSTHGILIYGGDTKNNLLFIFLKRRKHSCGFVLLPGVKSFLQNSSISHSLLCAIIVIYVKTFYVIITRIQFYNYCFMWLSFKSVKKKFY